MGIDLNRWIECGTGVWENSGSASKIGAEAGRSAIPRIKTQLFDRRRSASTVAHPVTTTGGPAKSNASR